MNYKRLLLAAFMVLTAGVFQSLAQERTNDTARSEMSDAGDAEAQYIRGSLYESDLLFGQTNEAEAVKWYRKAAEQGHAGAQTRLANMYAEGRGVTKDEAEAVKWYRKAAEQGYAGGQFGLGEMYSKGHGVTKDEAEAAKWYLKAAEQDDIAAQFVLFTMYMEGRGVPKDQALGACRTFFEESLRPVEQPREGRGPSLHYGTPLQGHRPQDPTAPAPGPAGLGGRG